MDAGRTKITATIEVFYAAIGFTKADVIDYYTRISTVLLPHLKDRPISLKRYPDGVDGFFFYEKQQNKVTAVCSLSRQEKFFGA